jgi:hypothetical protein
MALDADNKILSGPSDQLVWRIIPPTPRPGFHSFLVVKKISVNLGNLRFKKSAFFHTFLRLFVPFCGCFYTFSGCFSAFLSFFGVFFHVFFASTLVFELIIRVSHPKPCGVSASEAHF